MSTTLSIPYSYMLFYMVLAFAAGAVLAALIAAALYRAAIRPVINVAVPDVHLPDSLAVTIQQPPPLAAPLDRGALWTRVYDLTLDARGYPSCYTDVAAAKEAADAAVRSAFANASATSTT